MLAQHFQERIGKWSIHRICKTNLKTASSCHLRTVFEKFSPGTSKARPTLFANYAYSISKMALL